MDTRLDGIGLLPAARHLPCCGKNGGPGTNWNLEIDKELLMALVVLLLIRSSFE